ncbi:MAG: sodium/proline symporter [Clostridia bacterium]|nr:sodium/proline symporter [Clostridia bacterium]
MKIAAFVFYFILMLGIGIYFFVKSRRGDEKDYFLGGRQMGPWVTAMSAQASDMSAWLLMGLPGSVMAFGFGKVWIGIGLALGTAANWIFVAKRLRKFSKTANDSITLPQYLSNRFGGNKALQIISAVIFLAFFTIYVASSFVAGRKVFTSLFPKLDPTLAMVIFALVILTYTFLGGFRAVCWTDFFQGSLMLIALLAIPIVVVITQDLNSAALTQSVFGENTYNFSTSFIACGWKDIVSGLAWGLGYFGMPHILVRFMSIKKVSMVKKSAIVAIIWVVLALVAVCVMAVFGRMLLAKELLTEGKQEMVFITMAEKYFPPLIAGLLMAAVMAASMSTADSQLLVASSSFTSDIYKPMIRKNRASNKEVMWVGRGIVLIVAVVAFFVANSKSSGAGAIMNIVEQAWGGFGSSFGPVVLLSLFWRKLSSKGAIAGIVGGAAVDVGWLLCFDNGAKSLITDIGLYELFPGFFAGLVLAIVFSLIGKKASPETVAIFDRAVTSKDDE